MDQERTLTLLARYVAGEASAEEMEELEWAFLANPELRRLAALLPELRQSPPKGVSAEEEQQLLERGLERFAWRNAPEQEKAAMVYANPAPPADATLPEPDAVSSRPVRRLPVRWIAAASVLLVIAGSILYFQSARQAAGGRVAPIVLAAKKGVRRFMKLPDGSQLWLNAGSKIVLGDGYADGRREVVLEGEAFFDVQHDPQHPFIIHTGRLEVRVLGTSLNVKAYPGDSSVETTLINGRVEIGVTGDSKTSIVLHPNEKVIIPASGGPALNAGTVNAGAVSAGVVNGPAKVSVKFVRIVPDQTDGTIAETSWVENKLVFRRETLAGMAVRLERWYNVKIVFDSERYQRDTISGTFPDEPIAEVMHALQITAGFHYRIGKDTVRIW
jgi:transmembrane sensor